eukprot:scaffold564777_cov24-Prasinocladus_malaysianus.AAC.1
MCCPRCRDLALSARQKTRQQQKTVATVVAVMMVRVRVHIAYPMLLLILGNSTVLVPAGWVVR